jgi:hypothetical protein
MEIISRGVHPNEREYQTQCSKCYTTFKFKQSEGRVEYDQRDGDAVVAECPACGKECWVALRSERYGK